MYKLGVNRYFVLKASLVVILPIIFFKNELNIILNEALNYESSNYIILIPFMMLYLIYQKRSVLIISSFDRENNDMITNKDIIGIFFILTSIILKLNMFNSFNQLKYSLSLLPIFLIGIILILFNYHFLRILIFPILLLIFLIPPPLNLITYCGNKLSSFSSIISYDILSLFFNNLTLNNYYGTPCLTIISVSQETISFTLDIACSGLYSLISALLFIIYLVYILKGPISKRILLTLIGTPVFYILNILRIMIIVVIGYFFGSGISTQVIHLFSGSVLIVMGTLTLLLISQKYLKLSTHTSLPSEPVLKNSSDGYSSMSGKITKPIFNKIKLARVPMITILLFLSSSPYLLQFPEYVSSTNISSVNINEEISYVETPILLPETYDFILSFIYRDYLFQNISNQDASLVFLYDSQNETKNDIWATISVADTMGDLHPWDVCLIPSIRNGFGEQYDLRDITISEDPPIVARYFAFSKPNSDTIQVTLFWFTRGVFKTVSDRSKKWVMLSLYSNTNDVSEISEIEDYLLPLAIKVAQHWYPLSHMSDRMILITRIIPVFKFIIIVITLFMIAFNAYYKYSKKRKANIVFSKLIDYGDIKLLENINEIKDKIVTEKNIADYVFEKDGINIDLITLHNKLLAAESLGIIERKMVYMNDFMFYSWYKI